METENRFEIKKWNAVALWSWDIKVDTCAICKSHIMEDCIDCQANPNSVFFINRAISKLETVLLPGEYAIMPIIVIVSVDGLRTKTHVH